MYATISRSAARPGLIVGLAGRFYDRALALAESNVAAVARVLITGMSGAGKSTLLAELMRRGHLAVDTDYGGWVTPTGLWDEARMARLLATEPTLVVSGTVENQGSFYDRFEHVVLLSAPIEVLIERVSIRVGNPYGKSAEEQVEMRGYVATVEPLLRAGATVELDTTRPVVESADAVERLLIEKS